MIAFEKVCIIGKPGETINDGDEESKTFSFIQRVFWFITIRSLSVVMENEFLIGV
ncbi:MAG: hypothetical protein N3G21_05230 [Candidatus Hydrogenedentes bacterium]|nr:hypothetical protein [Candidatus Hydrogenedentota bacterium]